MRDPRFSRNRMEIGLTDLARSKNEFDKPFDTRRPQLMFIPILLK